jgi:Outer membrane protein beta-barrel domain
MKDSSLLYSLEVQIRRLASKEIHQMSRSISTSDSSAVSGPAALHPAMIRYSLALVVVTALTAFALRAQAQSPAQHAINVRPVVGALVATGDERDVLKNAVLVGGQASYTINSNFALLGSFGWSPSEDKTTSPRPKVDLYQYDLGLEGRLDDLTSGSAVATRPFAALGGGARTYNLRNVPGSSAQTNPLAFGAIGVDVGPSSGRVGVRLEARDNLTWFKGLRGELQDRNTRNDVQFAAGLTFGF